MQTPASFWGDYGYAVVAVVVCLSDQIVRKIIRCRSHSSFRKERAAGMVREKEIHTEPVTVPVSETLCLGLAPAGKCSSHLQWGEDVPLQIFIVRLTRNALDDQAQSLVSQVAVGEPGSRREIQLGARCRANSLFEQGS